MSDVMTPDAEAPPAARPAPAPDNDRRRRPERIELLTFTMKDEYYAVDIMRVREIRGWAKPTPLPHAPRFMRGVINLRGAVLPILDLSARLAGEETEATARNVIIVVELADQIAGLLVDAVSDILTLEKSELQPPPDMPGDGAESCISALTVVEDTMIRMLDPQALLRTAGEPGG
jgi:purine-binding chemotaxis protein CheW